MVELYLKSLEYQAKEIDWRYAKATSKKSLKTTASSTSG